MVLSAEPRYRVSEDKENDAWPYKCVQEHQQSCFCTWNQHEIKQPAQDQLSEREK